MSTEPRRALQVRIDGDVRAWLLERSERSMTQESADLRVRTELALWRGHLAAELARHRWTVPEIGCIADICNGTIISDSIGAPMTAEVADAFGLDPGVWGEKWGIDESKLLARIQGLGPTAQSALAEAVARWWALDDSENTPAGWSAVGVRVLPEDSGTVTRSEPAT